jgi:hypothetical protein
LARNIYKIEELRNSLRDRGYVLEEITHIFNDFKSENKFHYPSLLLKFSNQNEQKYIVYSVSELGAAKYVSTYIEGEF